MADIESNIRFGVDTSDAIASIKMLQAQISAFQKQMASSSVSNAESARKLRRGLLDDLNATGQWAASIKTIKSTSDSFTNALEKNKLSMGEYFRFGASQVTGFRNIFASEFNTIEKVARERVKDLQTQYISLGRDANGALKAIAVRPLKLDMESLATQTAINAQRQQIFNQLLKQGSTNLLNFGKNTQWAGRQLMVGFTIPLSIFGNMAGKTFMELEEQAIRFKRVYGELFTPPEEADEMLETLKELGKEFTKYGVAVEKTLGLAADAAAMGKTGVELLDQVTEANRLAVLGSVDQQQALETTISLTNAFGTATEELAKKIDFLNAVENQTVVSIEDLTIAIPKAGPVVQQLGGDVEDLAFFLTAMKEGGINASESANALKSGLASLINPTEQAANMMKVFGINVKDIVAQSRGDVKKLVLDFAGALDQLDPSQRAQAIEQLFGKFQFSRLSTLFQNVIKEGTQASRVLELTNATTEELAQLSSRELKRVEESTTFRFRKAIEEFQLAIAPVGEEFLKLITPIIEFATKIIEKFNSLSDNAKSFIAGLTILLGAVGPVALMTFGLLANGVANIIKGFTFVRELFLKTGKQSSILGEQFDYLTTEQLQAAAVAASLDQVHQTLIQTFSSEAGAVENLANVYRKAFNEQQRFDTGRAVARQAGLRLANGIVSVPGPKGAGDIVPAVLSPGEAVIPADAAKKYAPIIQGMIAGNLPGFSQGVMLGMPRSGKGTAKDREAAEQIYEMFKQSSYANVPPREYGHQLAKTSGHSFPIFGLGGVYMSPEGKKVFVKPVLDERAAVAEMRATQIARQAHGLKSPEQRIVVMRDPTDVRRQRKFLALESALDATFVNNDPMALFNEDQYFRQLVASLLRVDKDLSASNVFGDVVADVGPAGVFTRASGQRDYAESLPSMEEQAMINLLGIKGGAKRAFAESTLALMAGLTPQQYHQRMIAEIQQVLPLLKQTIAGFGLTDPREIQVYADMVKRLEQGLGVDWSKFHAIHSAVKPSKPKQTTVPGYEDGVVSVPGPKGAGDVMPAMLSPGEAVIPADKAEKYAGFIQQMIYGKIPGYEDSNVPKRVRPTQTRLRGEFGVRGETRVDASHLTSAIPSKALATLKNAFLLLGDEVEDITVQVVEYTEKQDANGKKTRETTASIMKLSEVLQKFGSGYGMVTGGYTFAGSAILEPSVRNQAAYDKMAMQMSAEQKQQFGEELGAPETLQDVVFHGDLAAKALEDVTLQLTTQVRDVLENIVREGQNASAALASSASEQEELDFVIKQRKKAFENKIAADTGLETLEARNAKRAELDAKIASIEEAYHRERSQGVSQEQALAKAKARLVILANEEAKLEKEQIQTMHIGDVASNTLREGLRKTSKIRPTAINEAIPHIVGKSTPDTAATMVIDELGPGALVDESQIAQVVRDAIIRIFDRLTDTVVDTARDYGEIASPSRKTERVGEALVDGTEQGLLSGKDDAQQAGAIISESISNGALAGVPTQTGAPRRTRGRRAGGTMVGGQMVTFDPNTGGSREAAIAAEQHKQAVAAQLVAESSEKQSRALKRGTNRIESFNSVLMSGTFAISSVSGILSLFGGNMSELSQQIFGLSTALFGLMQISQLLTQTKIAERAATAASTAFGPIGMLGQQGPKTAAQAATGLGAIFSKLGVFIKALFGPIGLVVAGLTLLAGVIMFLVDQEEKRKKQIAALGDAAFLSAEKMKKAADLLGFTAKTTAFGQNITAGTAAAKDSEEAGLIGTLRASEDFKTSFATEIEALKTASKDNAEMVLKSAANQLFAAGATKDQVDAYVKALAQEAGQTNLDFSFTGIDFSKGGKDAIVKAAQDASNTFSNTFEKGLNDTNKKVAKGAVGVFASSFQALKDGLANNIMSADDFNTGLAEVTASLEELSADELKFVLPNLYEMLGLEETMKDIPNVKDQILLLQADAAGISITEDQKKALQNSQKSAKAAQVALRVRKQINDQLKIEAERQLENKRIEEERAIIDENYGAATAQLNDRVIALQNQSDAYQFLIDQGYEAEVAFDLAGDAGLAAGIKAAMGAGVGSQKWKDLKVLLDQVIAAEKKAPKSPTGGGEKSPFQEAIDSLQEQRKEIVNNSVAFAKLRKAGFDTASAMKAAEDPILAAALATTKVGTEKWNRLVKAIKTTQALLSKKEIQDLLRGGKIERADKQAQIVVSNALGRLGWTAEQIDEVLSDQEFTNTLAADLKDGKINSEALLNRLIQIKQMGKLDIELNLTTKEGAAEEFQKRYDKVVGFLEAKKQNIEVKFQLKTEKDEILIREAESLIASIQNNIDNLEADLTGIEEQEELINQKYDNRKNVLDDLAKANESIAKQQKNQLTLADALSQGDIAAAARAVQDIRSQQAQDNFAKQGDLLEVSREKELGSLRSKNGKTRAQIEEQIKKLKKDIFIIEEETIEPIRERIRTAEVDKARALDSINSQILRWDILAAKVNEAKLTLTPDEMAAMEYQAGLIADLLANWDKIEDKTAFLKIIKETVDGATAETTQPETTQPEVSVPPVEEPKPEDKDEKEDPKKDDRDPNKKDDKDPKKETPATKSKAVFDKSGLSLTGFMNKQDILSAAKNQVKLDKDNQKRIIADINRNMNPAEVARQASIVAGKDTQNRILKDIGINMNAAASATAFREASIAAGKDAQNRILKDIVSPKTTNPGMSFPTAGFAKPKPKTGMDTINDAINWLGTVTQFKDTVGKLGIRLAAGGMVPKYLRMGGLLPYKSEGGSIFKPLGTDIVPAMLTPGEFVVRKYAVDNFGVDKLKAINSGTYKGDSMYNYEVNVNVQTDANPDQIARAVMGQIRHIESQKIRGNRF